MDIAREVRGDLPVLTMEHPCRLWVDATHHLIEDLFVGGMGEGGGNSHAFHLMWLKVSSFDEAVDGWVSVFTTEGDDHFGRKRIGARDLPTDRAVVDADLFGCSATAIFSDYPSDPSFNVHVLNFISSR